MDRNARGPKCLLYTMTIWMIKNKIINESTSYDIITSKLNDEF